MISKPPRTVSTGILFLWGVLSCEVFYTILELIGIIPITGVEDLSPPWDFITFLITSLLAIAILIAIPLWIEHRKNWARILFIVLMSLYFLSWIADKESFSQPYIGLGIDIIQIFCSICAIFYLFLDDSNIWFKKNIK